MDNIITLRGSVSVGSTPEVEKTEPKDTMPNNAWAAAAISAISDRATWGCLLFVNEDGDFVRTPINAYHISLRGLFEVALEELKLE